MAHTAAQDETKGGTTSTLLTNLQPLGQEALVGLRTSFDAVSISLSNKDVQRIYRRLLVPIFLLSAGVYVAIHAFVLPIRLALWALGRTAPSDIGGWGGTFSSVIPLIAASIFRNLYRAPLDQAFLAVLKELDPKLASEVEVLPARGRREAMMATIKRSLALLAYGPILWALGFIPGVSMILRFVFQLYTLGRWLEPEWATCLAVVSVFPPTAFLTTAALQLVLSELYFFREILQPYLSRVKLGGREEAKLISQRRTAVLAFLVPVELMLLVPLVGPLTSILAHAMAAVALKSLLLSEPPVEVGPTAVEKKNKDQ